MGTGPQVDTLLSIDLDVHAKKSCTNLDMHVENHPSVLRLCSPLF